MNWELIARNWDLFRPCIQTQWPALTDQDLTYVEGDRRRLVFALRERYRLTDADADRLVRMFENPDDPHAEINQPDRKKGIAFNGWR